MQPFRNLSIRRKLALAMMLASGAGLLVASLLLGAFELVQVRQRMLQRAATWSSIAADHCRSALAAGDRAMAEAELRLLAHQQHVSAAWLYRADGSILASYARNPASPVAAPPAPASAGSHPERSRVFVFRPVTPEGGKPGGMIGLCVEAEDVFDLIVHYLAIEAGVLLVWLLATWVAVRRLQSAVSAPIIELAQAVKEVTEQRDYSRRVQPADGDEVGQLVNGFNQMLATIQARDQSLQSAQDSRARKHDQLQQELARRAEAEKKLQTAYDDVERQVRARTAELQKANDALREEIALREQMGHALSSAERRFQSLIEHSTDVVSLLDSEGTVLYVSPSVERVMGSKPLDVAGRSAFEWVHPEDLERVRARFAEALQAPGQPTAAEYRARHGDGSWRWIESIGTNLLADPAVGAVVVNFRDITARHEAAEMVRQAETRFRAMIEHSSDGITMINAQGLHTYVSPSTQRMLGYSEEEILGHSGFEMMHPDDVPRIQQMFAEAVAGRRGTAFMEYRYRHKDGSWRWCEAVGVNRLDDPNVRAVIINSRDITSRKQAEEALRRRMAAEHLVASVSSRLANATGPEVDTAIREVLADLGAATGADRSFLFRVSEDLAVAENTHEWCAPGVQSQMADLRRVPTAAFPWMLERLRNGEPLLLARVADLPAGADAERRLMEAGGVQSAVFVPIRHGGRLVGFIGCDAVRAGREWTDEDSRLLRTVGELVTDTAARLRAAEALRESEERWSTLLGHATSALQGYRPDGTVVYWNRASERVYGYTAAEAIGRNLGDLIIPPELQPHFQRTLAAARTVTQSGEFVPAGELNLRRKDGTRVWVHSTHTAVCRPGQAPALFCLDTDLSALKETTEALRESEERFRSFFELSADPVCIADVEGCFRRVNKAFTVVLGYSQEELLSRPFMDFIHPEDRAKTRQVIEEKLKRGETVLRFENRYLHKDGGVVWLEWTSEPSVAGDCVFAMARDITKRKRAERALRESEQKYRNLHETMTDAFVRVSLEGRIQEANRAYREMLGYTEEELRAFTYQDLTPSRWHEAQDKIIRDQVIPRGYSDVYQKEYRRKDGTVFPVELRTILIRDETGAPAGMWAIMRDITERKRAEAALHASEERYRTLAEAAHDLIFMVDRDDRVLYVNSFAARAIAKSPEAIIGRRRAELFPSTEAGRQEQNLRMVFKTGNPLYVEDSLPTPHGEMLIGTWLSPVPAPDGSVGAVLGISRDITERVLAEQAVHESYELLRGVLESTSDPVYVKDRDGRYVLVNTALAAAYGLKPDEVIGKTAAQLVPAAAAAEIEAEDRMVLADNLPHSFEEYFTLNDGVSRYFLNSKTPLRNEAGEIIGIVGVAHDISDRKQAEEAMKESESRLRVVFETSLDVIHRRNLQTDRYDFISPSIESLIGLPPAAFLGKGVAALLERLHPDDLPAAQQILARLDRGEMAGIQAEYRLQHADGSYRWVADRVSVMKDDRGQPLYLVGSARDITERKRAEEALLESQNRYESLFENLSDAAMIADVESGRILAANRQAEVLLGRPRDEIIGLHQTALHPPEMADECRRLFARHATSEHAEPIKCDVMRKDGSRVPVVIHGARFTVGGRALIVGVFRDITEQKRAEETLRRSEAMHRASVEAAGAVPYARDFASNTYAFMGDGITALTGYEPAEFTPDLWHRIVQEGIPTGEFAGMTHEAAMTRFHEQRMPAWTCDYRLQCRGGEDRWVACAAVDVRDAEGRSVRSIGMLQDISPRKRAEAAQREAHDLLEQRVAERTAELSREVNEREHAEAALRHLSGRLLQLQDEERRRMARELHDTTAQTLAALAINLSLINQHAARLVPDARRALGESLALADQCSQEIRTMSYLLHPPLLDEFGLVTTLRWYADGFSKRSNVRVELDLPPKTDRLPREIETTFFRIVQESLANIHRHSGSPVARISLTHTDRDATLVVQDEGRGMTPSAPEDTRARIGRLGVGITGMRERVRQLNGRLDIQSSPGGTTITVTIPITQTLP